ncbi:response regulator transcription factor [Dactylosporangium roseum]|uniref:Response regulator transcription factor n=1 Tax=Dactylosporangium roseum TaxID=47989 RepID=A0ABY5YX33_9ACTN|nr:response regulator transcription factor [Dactylosporangium roseum]UWZ34316.1 response regulator transcription factor [Dactylosporangium roseum]
MANILLIDEDCAYRRTLAGGLTQYGHVVSDVSLHAAGRVLADLTCHTHQRPDVVLIDPFLPTMDGLLLLRLVCVGSRRPVMLHTAEDIEEKVVQALRGGADGFVPKPGQPAVLDAKIGALLRRVPAAPPPAPCVVGALRVDVAERRVSLDGVPVAVTRTEFDLLACLAEHPGRVVSRAVLRTRLGRGGTTSTNGIDVLVHRLRTKLGEPSARVRYLHTVRGKGVSLHAADRDGERHRT